MKPQPGAIQIGNQTAFSAATLMQPFEYALENDFDAFEWFPDKKLPGGGWDENDLTPALRLEIRDAARSRAMRLSVHARWTINPLLSNAAPLLRPEIDLAQELGASVLVLHLYLEAGLPAYVAALLPVTEWAAASGLKLAVENTVQTAPADFNALFDQLQELAPSKLAHVGMCLDIGHANLCAATRNDYLSFFDQLQSNVPIIHVHAHENWGDADTHLTLFTGPSALTEFGIRGLLERLKQRCFNGSIILEQWPHPPSLLNRARDQLLRIWTEPKAVSRLRSATVQH